METTAPVYTKPNDKTSVSFYGLRWKKRVPASSPTKHPTLHQILCFPRMTSYILEALLCSEIYRTRQWCCRTKDITSGDFFSSKLLRVCDNHSDHVVWELAGNLKTHTPHTHTQNYRQNYTAMCNKVVIQNFALKYPTSAKRNPSCNLQNKSRNV